MTKPVLSTIIFEVPQIGNYACFWVGIAYPVFVKAVMLIGRSLL
jgi:hypothetical protein